MILVWKMSVSLVLDQHLTPESITIVVCFCFIEGNLEADLIDSVWI